MPWTEGVEMETVGVLYEAGQRVGVVSLIIVINSLSFFSSSILKVSRLPSLDLRCGGMNLVRPY